VRYTPVRFARPWPPVVAILLLFCPCPALASAFDSPSVPVLEEPEPWGLLKGDQVTSVTGGPDRLVEAGQWLNSNPNDGL
jgi:hypothetical protein